MPEPQPSTATIASPPPKHHLRHPGGPTTIAVLTEPGSPDVVTGHEVRHLDGRWHCPRPIDVVALLGELGVALPAGLVENLEDDHLHPTGLVHYDARLDQRAVADIVATWSARALGRDTSLRPGPMRRLAATLMNDTRARTQRHSGAAERLDAAIEITLNGRAPAWPVAPRRALTH